MDEEFGSVWNQVKNSWKSLDSTVTIENVLGVLHEGVRVITITVTVSFAAGRFFGNPCYFQFPGSKAFQHDSLVQLERPASKGDCGSWVINAEDWDLFDHIITGGLASCV